METQALRLAARDDMIAEARDIIDHARARGVVLRLYGGLAVRAYCDVIEFCARDYSDFDMIGLKAQRVQLRELFADLGFTEDHRVAQGTMGAQLQFARPCVHAEGDARTHPDDHIDVFLDTFRMDHQIDLKDRLTLDDYTISPTDQLLTKLQVFHQEEKDVRDVLTLLKDVELAEDEGPADRRRVIAQRCAADWGLYHDVRGEPRPVRGAAGPVPALSRGGGAHPRQHRAPAARARGGAEASALARPGARRRARALARPGRRAGRRGLE